MAVIWGLDLKEIQWGKFKSSYMWNNEYHLRRTKFIVYQLAMIFCVVSESLGTAALSDYVDQQDAVKALDGATVHNNSFVGAFSYNIFSGVYVATIFGSAFFFDLFWPERHESPAVKLAWKICSLLAIMFVTSAAIVITVIVFTRDAYVTGVSRAEAERVLGLTGTTGRGTAPLAYDTNNRAIASIAFIWPGLLATIASTALLWHSLAHIDKYGPKSTHARDAEKNFPPDDGSISVPMTDGATGHTTTDGASRAPVDDIIDTGTMGPVPATHGTHFETPADAGHRL